MRAAGGVLGLLLAMHPAMLCAADPAAPVPTATPAVVPSAMAGVDPTVAATAGLTADAAATPASGFAAQPVPSPGPAAASTPVPQSTPLTQPTLPPVDSPTPEPTEPPAPVGTPTAVPTPIDVPFAPFGAAAVAVSATASGPSPTPGAAPLFSIGSGSSPTPSAPALNATPGALTPAAATAVAASASPVSATATATKAPTSLGTSAAMAAPTAPAPLSGTARAGHRDAAARGVTGTGRARDGKGPGDGEDSEGPPAWPEKGLEYRFSLGMVWPYNGQALSYIPIELGWRFSNGLRMRIGMESFYYQGLDIDPNNPAAGEQEFSYQMLDLRLSFIYVWPLPWRLRPLAGITVESVGLDSNRQVSNPYEAEQQYGAYSFIAPGFELGLEYRGGPGWALSLDGRVVEGFSTPAHMEGTDLGWHYLF